MTFPSTPLRSRFGRRLLALFVGCAFVPMAVLAALSYRHVKQQLYRQSENRLQQANLALSQAIFDRLLLLDATLKSIPPQAILQLLVAKQKIAGAESQARGTTPAGKSDPNREPGWAHGHGWHHHGPHTQAGAGTSGRFTC